jgi:hypothetical protein
MFPLTNLLKIECPTMKLVVVQQLLYMMPFLEGGQVCIFISLYKYIVGTF